MNNDPSKNPGAHRIIRNKGVILDGKASEKPSEEIYKNVKPTKIGPVHKEEQVTYSTKYETDFTLAAKDFWQKKAPDIISNHTQGITSGKFGKKSLTISNFFDRIYQSMRDFITAEFKKQGKSTEDIKDNLFILEGAFKILGKAIDTKDGKIIDAQKASAHLQGFANGFVETLFEDEDE